jgi:hypothetical protein
MGPKKEILRLKKVQKYEKEPFALSIFEKTNISIAGGAKAKMLAMTGNQTSQYFEIAFPLK